jgi:hypothetical protein
MHSTSTRKQILVIDPDASLAKRLIDDTCGNLVEVATVGSATQVDVRELKNSIK